MHAHLVCITECEDGQDERTGKDGEQAPGGGDANAEILRDLEEDQREADEQLREEARFVRQRVDTECLEGGETI